MTLPAHREHLTPKFYVDEAISHSVNESSLLSLDASEILKPDEQDTINPNSTLTTPKTIFETPTKSYNDSLHKKSRNKRDLSSVFNYQENEFDNNILTMLDSISVNRKPHFRSRFS